MRRNVIETIMGAVVLLVAAFFLWFVYNSSSIRQSDGYEVSARFNRVDGLVNGSDVRLSGIKVGSVVDSRLDPESYLAVVRMALDDSVQLPTDSVARIASEGLLGGGNYIALEPGVDEAKIPPGGEIARTQDAVSLTELLGKLAFGAGQQGAAGAGAPARGAPAGASGTTAPGVLETAPQ